MKHIKNRCADNYMARLFGQTFQAHAFNFCFRNCIDYECMLVFKGLLQEPPRYLLVTATGSFDGGHEDLVSTATL